MPSIMQLLFGTSLCCSMLAAQAESSDVGDFWLIHQQGDMPRNEVFIVDGEPSHIVSRPGGVKSLGVYRLYEDPSKVDMTAYDIEVDCKNDRVRIKNGHHVNRLVTGFRQAKVASQWQKKPDVWLAQSRDFQCRPDQRQARFMIPMGQMQTSRLFAVASGLFMERNKQARFEQVVRAVDQAFEQMPAKSATGKGSVQ